jgi:nucleoside-diphosphate-sugar epimerase
MIDGKNVCSVTGASGYVGMRIRDYLIRNGWIVYELRHSLESSQNNEELLLPYCLESEIHPRVHEVLKDVDVVIHCAYDFRLTEWQDIWDVNVNGSLKLLHVARGARVKKIIVLSTMSAFEGCKSLYGKAKLAIEKEAIKAGAIVIRPGLVFGMHAGGMIGSLKRVVSAFGIVPLIGNGTQMLYTTHEDDLCHLIFRISTEDLMNISEPIIAASEKAKTFRSILEILANSMRRKVIFIPLPWRLVWAGLKVFEMLGLHVGLRSDSVMSLVTPCPEPSFGLMKQIGAHFRAFDAETMDM